MFGVAGRKPTELCYPNGDSILIMYLVFIPYDCLAGRKKNVIKCNVANVHGLNLSSQKVKSGKKKIWIGETIVFFILTT